MNSIAVIGTGYVGLVIGTCLSEFGLNVLCMDTDAQKVANLSKGKIPIYEPGLPALTAKNVAFGRLRFSTDFVEAVNFLSVIFIAVNTSLGEDRSADLPHVLAAVEAIAKHLSDYWVIVNKSTVPVGIAHRVNEVIAAGLKRRGLILDFDVIDVTAEVVTEGRVIS